MNYLNKITFGIVFVSLHCFASYDLSIKISSTNHQPILNETVEVSFAIENLGPELAKDIAVVVDLPDTVEIANNQIPILSAGTFDQATNNWVIEELPLNAKETLTLPIEFTSYPKSYCDEVLADIDFLTVNEDVDEQNNHSSNRFFLNNVNSCFEAGLEAGNTSNVFDTYFIFLIVVNNGLEIEKSLTITAEQTSFEIDSFSFFHSFCSESSCIIEDLGPGEKLELIYRAESFTTSKDRVFDVDFRLSGNQLDNNPSNNKISQRILIKEDQELDIDYLGNDDGGSSSSGCFIATAAYGNELANEVTILKKFRDNILNKYYFGKNIISFYYKYSPPIASYISDKPVVKFIVRAILWPIVWAVEYPITIVIFFTLIFFITYMAFKRRRVY